MTSHKVEVCFLNVHFLNVLVCRNCFFFSGPSTKFHEEKDEDQPEETQEVQTQLPEDNNLNTVESEPKFYKTQFGYFIEENDVFYTGR